jgi:hypothetical protein
MTTRDKIQSYLENADADARLLEPAIYDDAILGIAERAGGLCVVAYDRQRCIEINMAMGMDRDEAEEYFEANTACAWVGDGTPVFIDTRFAE